MRPRCLHSARRVPLRRFLNLLLGKAVDSTEESLAALAEAERIYLSLQRLAPKIYDESGSCQQTVLNLAEALNSTRVRVKQ